MSDSDSIASSLSSSASSSDAEEPMFKYSRITQFPRTFFGKDPVSAAFVGNILAVGSHSGVLHLANKDLSTLRTTRIHRASITCIDTDGNYLATGSIDGTVVISSISDPQDVQPINLNRPVRAVALDPNYTQTRTYLSGGTSGAVTLNSRGWIKSRSETVLEQSSGSILAISWSGIHAIWCSEDGITIYDTSVSTTITHIPHGLERADFYKPSINIAESNTSALVAWGNFVWNLDLLQGRVLSKLTLDWNVIGVSNFDDKHHLILCCELNRPPELRLIDLLGNETYVDEVTMQGYQRLGPNDYHLKTSRTDGIPDSWYIFSATDAVVANPRDAHDHIDWLMEQEQYDEAYKQSSGVLDDDDRRILGLKAAKLLVNSELWSEASEALAQCLDPQEPEWKDWVTKFTVADQHIIIGKVIPQFDLGDSHTEILVWALKHDEFSALSKFLSTWDLDLFDKSRIISLLERNNSPQCTDLLVALYLRISEPERAVRCYLSVNDSRAFEIVEKYHLWNSMIKKLPAIMVVGLPEGPSEELDGRVEVLVNIRLELLPHKVVLQLEHEKSYILFLYLRSLAMQDEFLVKDFGDLMVKLYAEHDRDRLLNFLVVSGTYNLNYAIQICETDDYINELIYLYGQVGKIQDALELIINRLEDAQRAVSFAVEHNNADLWEYLISYSRDKPDFVIELLGCPEVAPARVIEIVPHTLKIPGLRSALYNVLKSQRAVLFLNEGVLRIVKAEAKEHLMNLQHIRREGQPVDVENTVVDWSEPVLLTPTGLEVVITDDSKQNGSWLSRKINHLVEALQYVNASY